MTVERGASTDKVAALIEHVVSCRRDLTDPERDLLAQVLTVACPDPPAAGERFLGRRTDRLPRSCGAPAGHECRNVVTGETLIRYLAHDVRIKLAGQHLPATDPHELKGNPKRISETGRGERMRRESGRAFPGWEQHQQRWNDR